jgi:hydroxypyruvate reductase
VHVIGFGKASCAAAAALADILGDRICQGVALGAEEKACRTINVCEATHPLPSARNVQLSERLVRECETVGPEDLVLVIASGGGSAMLCWPPSECEQAARLYTASLRAGLSIRELNTVRKHLSALKGGGLAKLLSPATVVGLVFSDVPGGSPELVASGPTYFDPSTAADAQAIIEKYRLGDFVLNETPKDPALFRRVTNIMLVSNTDALDAMAARASELGYAAIVAGGGLTDAPESLVRSMLDRAGPNTAVVAGGEATLVVPEGAREGGRNQHVALVAARMLAAGQAFASLASDGQDNGPHAGALVDADTAAPADDLARFADTAALARAGDLIETGATGANVSDLMLLLQE